MLSGPGRSRALYLRCSATYNCPFIPLTSRCTLELWSDASALRAVSNVIFVSGNLEHLVARTPLLVLTQ